MFGTLIKDGLPNAALVQQVQELLKQKPPRQVFFVSDSNPDDIARVLSTLPHPLPQIPVLAKTTLEGFELECLIDNDEPDYQGLSTRRYLTPEQAVEDTNSVYSLPPSC